MPTFQLNAPVVIRAKVKEVRNNVAIFSYADLLEMCLRSTYFSFGGNFYEEKEDAVMGFPGLCCGGQPLHGVL